MGAEIDGCRGTLGIAADKLTKRCVVTFCLLVQFQKKLNQKFVQVITGRWAFVLQFRRPGMSILQHTWKFIGGAEAVTSKLIRLARGELLSLVCSEPLLHTNLRASIRNIVVATDASETGGAVSWSG